MTSHNNTTSLTLSDLDPGIPWQRIALGVVLYGLVLVTVCGNALVLLAVAREKCLQTVFNVFLVNLAITDISVGLIAMNFFAVFNVLQRWPFGEALCGLWIYGDFGMTFSSIFTLLAISLDRYWSVHWSNHYRLHNNRRKAAIVTATIWTAMFVLWTPAFVMDRLNNSTPGECFYDPEKNKTFVTIVAVFGYHGSTVVMLFCYIKVFMFVRRRSKIGPLRRRNNGPDAETTLRDTAVSNGPSLQPTTNIPREGLSADVIELDDDNTSNPYVTAVSTNQGTAEKGIVESGSMEMQTTISVVQESSSRGLFLHPDAAKSEKEQKPKSVSTDTNTGQARDNIQIQENSGSCIGQNAQPLDSDKIQSKTTAVPQRASSQQSSISSNMKTALRREQKVFLTLTYVMVGYLICWMPFHVSFDVMAIDRTLVPERFYDVTYWLAYCNSAINPFLYNFSSPDFHRAFKRLMGRR